MPENEPGFIKRESGGDYVTGPTIENEGAARPRFVYWPAALAGTLVTAAAAAATGVVLGFPSAT